MKSLYDRKKWWEERCEKEKNGGKKDVTAHYSLWCSTLAPGNWSFGYYKSDLVTSCFKRPDLILLTPPC